MTGASLYLSHLQYLEVQSPGFLVLLGNIQHANLSALAVFLLHPKLAMAHAGSRSSFSSTWYLEAELVPYFWKERLQLSWCTSESPISSWGLSQLIDLLSPHFLASSMTGQPWRCCWSSWEQKSRKGERERPLKSKLRLGGAGHRQVRSQASWGGAAGSWWTQKSDFGGNCGLNKNE